MTGSGRVKATEEGFITNKSIMVKESSGLLGMLDDI